VTVIGPKNSLAVAILRENRSATAVNTRLV
jgi:hypothetical protein